MEPLPLYRKAGGLSDTRHHRGYSGDRQDAISRSHPAVNGQTAVPVSFGNDQYVRQRYAEVGNLDLTILVACLPHHDGVTHRALEPQVRPGMARGLGDLLIERPYEAHVHQPGVEAAAQWLGSERIGQASILGEL